MQEIKVFDANVYVGRSAYPKNSKIETVSELSKEMARVRLNKALVFHKEALNDPVFGNQLLISQIKECENLVGCAVLAPDASGEFGQIEDYFEFLVNSGVKAIRLFPKIHFYTLKPYVLHNVLEQAAIWNMPVLIDCVNYDKLGSVDSTWDFMPDYDDIYELAKAWPTVPFIVIIPGMTSQRQQYAILNACDNVYLETSGYSYRFIENVCKRFSAKRLVCGSYMPITDPAAMMTGVLYANISDEEKRLIAGKNLERMIANVGRKEAL